MANPVHVFLVSFPGQGHVNPLLRLGKILAAKGGLLVTFSSTKSIGNEMARAGATVNSDPIPIGNSGGMLRFEFFDDGWAEDDHVAVKYKDIDLYMSKLEEFGRKELPGIINRHAIAGRPVSCLIGNPFISWVCDVAEELNIASAVLWVQSCACFSAYYHYQNSLVPFPSEEQPNIDVQLPNMPVLKSDEIPSFLHPSTPYKWLQRGILGQFKNLSKPICVLVETFRELEEGLIEYMSNLCPIRPVGPLFQNPILETASDISGDLMKADSCLEWLDSKEASSVVYISFGSVVALSQEQVTEIAHGVLNSGVSFLWVLRKGKRYNKEPTGALPDGFLEAAGGRGKVVQWSPQAAVLSHTAVSCFVTHCGWNSTLEALSSGVPVVVFPQWGDQVTNAKYLVDEWTVGVRMCRSEAENRVVSREEVAECLREAVGGVRAVEMKENAVKWKKAAAEAVADGGTSNRNIMEFVEDVKRIRLEKMIDQQMSDEDIKVVPNIA